MVDPMAHPRCYLAIEKPSTLLNLKHGLQNDKYYAHDNLPGLHNNVIDRRAFKAAPYERNATRPDG